MQLPNRDCHGRSSTFSPRLATKSPVAEVPHLPVFDANRGYLDAPAVGLIRFLVRKGFIFVTIAASRRGRTDRNRLVAQTFRVWCRGRVGVGVRCHFSGMG